MRAGGLDWQIVIERVTITHDEFNAPVERWSTLATVWASKVDARMRDAERMRADGVSSEMTTRFRIRYSSTVADVSPKDRVTYGGRVYNIISVSELGRREGIEIAATAVAD